MIWLAVVVQPTKAFNLGDASFYFSANIIIKNNTLNCFAHFIFIPLAAFEFYSGFLKIINSCRPLRGNRQDWSNHTYKITYVYKFLAIVITRFFLLPLPQSLKKRVYNNLHPKYFKVLDSDFPIIIYKWPIDICTGVTSCGWNMAFYGKCFIFSQWCYWLTNPRVTDKTVTTKSWIVVDRYLQSC